MKTVLKSEIEVEPVEEEEEADDPAEETPKWSEMEEFLDDWADRTKQKDYFSDTEGSEQLEEHEGINETPSLALFY